MGAGSRQVHLIWLIVISGFLRRGASSRLEPGSEVIQARRLLGVNMGGWRRPKAHLECGGPAREPALL
jgi:hypothetical protein